MFATFTDLNLKCFRSFILFDSFIFVKIVNFFSRKIYSISETLLYFRGCVSEIVSKIINDTNFKGYECTVRI